MVTFKSLFILADVLRMVVQHRHLWYNIAICGTSSASMVQHRHLWYSIGIYGTTSLFVIQHRHLWYNITICSQGCCLFCRVLLQFVACSHLISAVGNTSDSRFEAIVDEIMHFQPQSYAHHNTLSIPVTIK